MDKYLKYMAPRLQLCYEVLKDTGSIYLHCDPTYSHYLKVLMDGIFGINNFRNEIVWGYTGPGSPKMRQFNRKHDIIFWYCKGLKWTFNRKDIRVPHKDEKPHNGGFKGKGRKITDKKYERKGKIPETWWVQKRGNGLAIAPRQKKQYLGYPTQKPLKLLERIIKASSNPGDLVLDPFCGSGTTLEAATLLKRNSIGIDLSEQAIQLSRSRSPDSKFYQGDCLEVMLDQIEPSSIDLIYLDPPFGTGKEWKGKTGRFNDKW